MVEELIEIDKSEYVSMLFGNFDKNIKIIEEEYNVSIIECDSKLKISGEQSDVKKAVATVKGLLTIIKRGENITEQNINYCMLLANNDEADKIQVLFEKGICVNSKGEMIRPRTLGQKEYCSAISENTITLGIGPAGTGKTFLAVAMAVAAFKAREVDRIILTRPAVEAGESLGFLPGDLQEKIDPYLRPLYDALFDMLSAESYYKYIEKGKIEIVPLAYMRGRTLDNSFIILDEAQNTTVEQMKMFLTRLGLGSKMVITGDITQIDLQGNHKSGLKDAAEVLKNIKGISQIHLNEGDVMRHKLVQDIIKAYNNKVEE